MTARVTPRYTGDLNCLNLRSWCFKYQEGGLWNLTDPPPPPPTLINEKKRSVNPMGLLH